MQWPTPSGLESLRRYYVGQGLTQDKAALQATKLTRPFSWVGYVSEKQPGVWTFQVGGLIFVLISIFGCGLWFIRTENSHMREPRTIA